MSNTKEKSSRSICNASGDLYAKIAVLFQDGICVVELDDKIRKINKSQAEYFNVNDEKEVCDTHLYNYFSESNHKNINDKKIVECSAATEYDEFGKPNCIVVEMKDLTKLKENEKTIKQLSTIIGQTSDTIFITDKDGAIEYLNNSLEIAYDYSKDELIGKNPRIFKSGIKDNDFYKNPY
jgi:transcriptional regulator with PAS, ATPase and Fis domain